MTKEDLQNIATAADLKEFERRIFDELDDLRETILKSSKRQKGSSKIFYSPKEFADVIGVSKATVSRWCHDGSIEATQQGGKGTAWLIPGSEIARLQKDCKEVLPTIKQIYSHV